MAEFFYICIFFCIFSVKNYLFQSITEVTSKNSLFEPPKKVGYKNSHSQTKEEVSFKHSQLLLESKREASLKVLYNNFQVKDIHMLCFLLTYFTVCFILKLEKKVALCHQVIFVIPLSWQPGYISGDWQGWQHIKREIYIWTTRFWKYGLWNLWR